MSGAATVLTNTLNISLRVKVLNFDVYFEHFCVYFDEIFFLSHFELGLKCTHSALHTHTHKILRAKVTSTLVICHSGCKAVALPTDTLPDNWLYNSADTSKCLKVTMFSN